MASTNSKRKSNVLNRWGRNCAWCSLKLGTKASTIDHVLCSSEGGSNWIGNLLPCCENCNRARADMPVRQWLRHCLDNGYKVRQQLVELAMTRIDTDPRCQNTYILTGEDPSTPYGRQVRAERSFRAAITALVDIPNFSSTGIG